jgi:glycosyltransferase involved in cell wall biosynthesis
MKKIFLLTQYGEWHEPSYFRFFQYLSYFSKKKIHITNKSLYNNTNKDYYKFEEIKKRYKIFPIIKRILDLEFENKYDILWVDGEALPGLPYSLESFFLPLNKKVVLDLGNTIHHKYENSNRFYEKTFLKDKISGLIQRADIVISRNSSIKEYVDLYKKENSFLLFTAINTQTYQPVSQVLDFSSNETLIGFIGTEFSSQFLIKIGDVLKEISRVYPIHVMILNGNEKIQLPVKYTHMRVSQEQEINELSKFDIGIFPSSQSLRESGNPGLGVLKCMALAKPVLANYTGTAMDYILHGENGFLCQSVDDWYLALRSLLDEREVAFSFGEKSRRRVETEFSLEKSISILQKIWDV